MSHYNSVENPTEINLDEAIMDSPSREEHDMPAQSSRLILEYANLQNSELSQIKIFQERDKKRYINPNVLGLIDLFTYVAIY